MTATLEESFVSFTNGNASVRIALQGATVVSYIKDGREILFVSSK
jgi:D-hexose-6-phosphate mutarotase